MWTRKRYFFGKNVDDSNWYLWSDTQEPHPVIKVQYQPLLGPYKRKHLALVDASKQGVKVKEL